jgi:phosphoribosylaminoimidazole (AIR) synthetase
VLVVKEKDAGEILVRLTAMGESAWHIGAVEARKEDEKAVQFVGSDPGC